MEDDLSVRSDLALLFGDADDGAIGVPVTTSDCRVVEVSYFFGKTRPKNIVVISSQAGCPMRCSFCELGPEAFGRNLTAREMRDQAVLMFAKAKAHGYDVVTVPHKITVANSGEPFLNPHLVDGLESLTDFPVSFKVSTVFPSSKAAGRTLESLADFAANYARPVQLQISLISTSQFRRSYVSGGQVADFRRIREAGEQWRTRNPNGRKVNLSLILTSDMPCSAEKVADLFPPDLFRFRFREYVPTESGAAARLQVVSAERLKEIKSDFQDRGYDVADWASPSPIERRFGLASNVIRKTYLKMLTPV